jgi:hypothetical protein
VLTSAGDDDAFLATYTAEGSDRWHAAIARAAGDDQAAELAVRADGTVLVLGVYVGGPADLGGGERPSAGASDFFVASFAADGAYLWDRTFGGSGAEWPSGIGALSDGSALAAVQFASASIEVGGEIHTNTGTSRGLLTMLAPNGDVRWTRSYGDDFDDVAVGAASELFVAGDFTTDVDFGEGPVASAGDRDTFVMRHDPDGTLRWARIIGGPESDEVEAVSVSGDTVVAVGEFAGTVDFGGGPRTAVGGVDAFVAAYAIADGAPLWDLTFGGSGDDEALHAAHAGDHLLVLGRFSGTVDFGAGPRTTSGPPELFLLCFR